MMKKAQQMRTMFPMGLREEMSVSTTNFSPGARLMTLRAGKGGQGTVSHSRQRDSSNLAHSHQAGGKGREVTTGNEDASQVS